MGMKCNCTLASANNNNNLHTTSSKHHRCTWDQCKTHDKRPPSPPLKRREETEAPQSNETHLTKRPKMFGDNGGIVLRCRDELDSSDFSLASVDISMHDSTCSQKQPQVEKQQRYTSPKNDIDIKQESLWRGQPSQNLDSTVITLNRLNDNDSPVPMKETHSPLLSIDSSMPSLHFNDSSNTNTLQPSLCSLRLGGLGLDSTKFDFSMDDSTVVFTNHRNTSEDNKNSYGIEDELIKEKDTKSKEEHKALLMSPVDKDKNTALHLTIQKKDEKAAFEIIRKASCFDELNARNVFGQTPLHVAVVTGQAKIVRKLITAGAMVGATDQDGNTPLHVACRSGCMDIVQNLTTPVQYEETKDNTYMLLIQAIPQHMDIKNNLDQDCKTVAYENGHDELHDLLYDIEYW